METFSLVCPPLAGNTFLSAQSGVFIEFSSPCAYYCKHGRWPELVETELLISTSFRVQPEIVKLTLPKSLSGELLRALWRSGISAAQLMPTFDHVVAALESRWLREDFGNPSAREIQSKLTSRPK